MKLRAVEFDGSNHKRVLTETGVNIGMLYLDVDGSYYYEPREGGGYFGANNLRDIANLLDEINAPFDRVVKEFFDKEREKEYGEADFLVDEFTGVVYPKKNK